MILFSHFWIITIENCSQSPVQSVQIDFTSEIWFQRSQLDWISEMEYNVQLPQYCKFNISSEREFISHRLSSAIHIHQSHNFFFIGNDHL